MSEITDRYRVRADAFEAKVAGTPRDRWLDQSPCEDWKAVDVVRHIVDMHGAMLTPIGRWLTPTVGVDEDPLTAFRSARADVEAVLRDPTLADLEVDTPAGRMSAAEHVDQVVSADMVLHGWDLARATGQDDTIDPAEVEAMLPFAESMPPDLRIPGAYGPGIVVYGPAVEVPADATPQDRLMALLGRDPQWTVA